MAKQQAKLMRVADAPTVQKLEAYLQGYRDQLPDRKARLDNADRALEVALAEADRVKVAVLAGRASDADLAAAQNHLAECQVAQATAFHDHADIARYTELLPAEIEVAKQAARVEVAASLRAQYGAALEDLRGKLLAAKAVSDEVARLHDLAANEFNTSLVDSRYHSAVIDAGEGGLLVGAAGLPNLSFPELTPLYRNQPTRLDGWLKAVDDLLAELPQMAERDKERRVNHDSFEAQQAEVERKKEAAWAAMLRRDMERIGLTLP
jgi:hypothetical protein